MQCISAEKLIVYVLGTLAIIVKRYILNKLFAGHHFNLFLNSPWLLFYKTMNFLLLIK